MIEQAQFDWTGKVGSDLPLEKPDAPDPLGMACALSICFAVGWAGAYVVMKTDWSILVKLYAGTNGVFFAATGLVALVNVLRNIATRFTVKYRAREGRPLVEA